MKTSFFKKILPALAIMLALGGAFGSLAMNRADNDKSAGVFLAYIKNNPLGTSCTEAVMCSDAIGPICTINDEPSGTQLWHLNANGRCVREAYKIQ